MNNIQHQRKTYNNFTVEASCILHLDRIPSKRGLDAETWRAGRKLYRSRRLPPKSTHKAIFCLSHYLWYGDNDVPALRDNDDLRAETIYNWFEAVDTSSAKTISKKGLDFIKPKIVSMCKWRSPSKRKTYVCEELIDKRVNSDQAKFWRLKLENEATRKIVPAFWRLAAAQDKMPSQSAVSRTTGVRRETIRKRWVYLTTEWETWVSRGRTHAGPEQIAKAIRTPVPEPKPTPPQHRFAITPSQPPQGICKRNTIGVVPVLSVQEVTSGSSPQEDKGRVQEWIACFREAESTDECIAYWESFHQYGWTNDEHKEASLAYAASLRSLAALEYRAKPIDLSKYAQAVERQAERTTKEAFSTMCRRKG